MNIASQIFAGIAAALHVLIFCMESLWFMRPQVYKRFGANSAADAEARRLFAYNQGFYNLFLAIGCGLGLVLLQMPDYVVAGRTLVLFTCASILGAGLVLLYSGGSRMLRAALMQGLPPALAIGLYLALG